MNRACGRVWVLMEDAALSRLGPVGPVAAIRLERTADYTGLKDFVTTL